MLADQANSAQPSFHASQSWPQDNSAAFRQCADRQATGDSQASAVDAARGFGYSHNQQYPQHGSQQAYQNNYAGQQYSHSQSSACSNQYPQQSQFISSIPSYNTAQTASQQGMANPYNASAYQNQYQQQSQPTQMASHYTQSQLQQAGPAQSMSGSYTQLPNSYSMHTQPSALSSQLSTTGSASSLAPSGSFASTTTAQQQTGTSIFGGDYISGNGDILYVRERPVKPQKEDGVVKCPVGNGGFHDAFKLDWESQCVVIKDLPSKEAKCSVRKRTMGLHTWGIYKGGDADRHNLLGQVRKASSTRMDVSLEKTPQNSFTAEGNLADMTYTIKAGSQIAAQGSASPLLVQLGKTRVLEFIPRSFRPFSGCQGSLSRPSLDVVREDKIVETVAASLRPYTLATFGLIQ